MREKITIVNPDGVEETLELITELESDDGKHYIVYTKNEEDENENIIVYTSRVEQKDGQEVLEELTDDEYDDIQMFLDSLEEE